MPVTPPLNVKGFPPWFGGGEPGTVRGISPTSRKDTPVLTVLHRALAGLVPAAAVVALAVPASAATAIPQPGSGPFVAPAPTTQGIIMRDGGICDPIRHMGC